MGLHAPGSKTETAIVLIVNDDDGARSAHAAALRSAGYTVEEATTRATALATTRRARPDLVILDRTLPDGDGFAIVGDLRRLVAELPIIALAPLGRGETMNRSLVAGCDAFLETPCDPEAIVAQVSRLLALRAPKTTLRRRRFDR